MFRPFGGTSTNTGGASLFGGSTSTSGGAFGGAPVGGTSPFGQAAPSGASIFGQPAQPIGQPVLTAGSGGTGNPPYVVHREQESGITVNFQSISAMPQYAGKSYEELRLEDYALGRKGLVNPFGQQPSSMGYGGMAAPSSTGLQQQQQPPATSFFGQQQPAAAAASAFGRPAAPAPSAFGGFGGASQPAPTSTAFGAPSAPAPQTTSLFGAAPSTGLFGQPAAPSTAASSGGGLFGQTAAPSAFGQPQATSAFGGVGAFGSTGPAATPFGAQPSGTLAFGGFGSKPASSSNLFGAPATAAPTSGGLFGQQPQQQQTSSVFGGFGQSAPQQTSAFGAPQPSQQQQQQATPSLFGSSTGGGGLFGQQQPHQQSAFGSSFGQSQQQQPTQQQQPASSGLFGAPSTSSTTATSAFQPSSGLFGSTTAQQQQSAASSSNLFNIKPLFPSSTAAPSATGQPQTSSSLFPSTNQQQQPSFFGTSTMSAPQAAPSSSLFNFGQQPQQQQYSTGSSTAPMSSMFSFPSTSSSATQQAMGGMMGSTPSSLPFVNIPAAMSIAPPLPPALAAIKPVSGSSAKSDAAVTPKTTAASSVTSSWRLRLREASEAVTPAAPLQTAPSASAASQQGVMLVPRKTSNIKTLIVEPASYAKPPVKAAFDSQPATGESVKSATSEGKGTSQMTASTQERFGDFYTSPSERVLGKYSEEQLAAVTGFTVGQRGIGEVRFLRPVDLRGVNLDDLFSRVVLFEPKQVTVYPDPKRKPARGQGLNVPAEIRLERCWPVSRATRQPLTDPTHERYREHRERLKVMEGCRFVDFVDDTGTWIFQVDHFSTYGVPWDLREYSDSKLCVGEDVSIDADGEEEPSTAPMDFNVSRVSIHNPMQRSYRVSIDVHGRLSCIHGTRITLAPVEERCNLDSEDLEDLIGDDYEIGLLSNLATKDPTSQDFDMMLREAVEYYGREYLNSIAPLSRVILLGDMNRAAEEAARANFPWLAALLQSPGCRCGAREQLRVYREEDVLHSINPIVLFSLRVLAGDMDAVFTDSPHWVIRYAASRWHSKEDIDISQFAKQAVTWNTVPNGTIVNDALYCVLSGDIDSIHPMSFPPSTGLDMLRPFLLKRRLGRASSADCITMYEQLMAGGCLKAARKLSRDVAPLLPVPLDAILPQADTLPQYKACLQYTQGFHEHALRLFLQAGDLHSAARILDEHVLDTLFLKGEHDRLSGYLAVLAASDALPAHLTQFLAFLQGNDSHGGMEVDMASVPLLRRISFAEMAAHNPSNPAVSKLLPPDLHIQAAHRYAANLF